MGTANHGGVNLKAGNSSVMLIYPRPYFLKLLKWPSWFFYWRGLIIRSRISHWLPFSVHLSLFCMKKRCQRCVYSGYSKLLRCHQLIFTERVTPYISRALPKKPLHFIKNLWSEWSLPGRRHYRICSGSYTAKRSFMILQVVCWPVNSVILIYERCIWQRLAIWSNKFFPRSVPFLAVL